MTGWENRLYLYPVVDWSAAEEAQVPVWRTAKSFLTSGADKDGISLILWKVKRYDNIIDLPSIFHEQLLLDKSMTGCEWSIGECRPIFTHRIETYQRLRKLWANLVQDLLLSKKNNKKYFFVFFVSKIQKKSLILMVYSNLGQTFLEMGQKHQNKLFLGQIGHL